MHRNEGMLHLSVLEPSPIPILAVWWPDQMAKAGISNGILMRFTCPQKAMRLDARGNAINKPDTNVLIKKSTRVR